MSCSQTLSWLPAVALLSLTPTLAAGQPAADEAASEKPPAQPAPAEPGPSKTSDASAGEAKEAAPSPAPPAPAAQPQPLAPASPDSGAAPPEPGGRLWAPPGDEEPLAPASAPPTSAPEPADPEDVWAAGPLGTYQNHFVGWLGVRVGFISDAGFDAFSDEDALVQFSLGFGRTLLSADALSVAALAAWDYGSASNEARGADTDLDVHRFVLGPEIRYHVAPWLYVFGRPLPAAIHTRASLDAPVIDADLYSRGWSFGFDATAGAAVQLWGKRSGASNKPRLWAQLEGGYGWATSVDLKFRADDADAAPQRVEDVDLGSLAVRGPMFRIALALTF